MGQFFANIWFLLLGLILLIVGTLPFARRESAPSAIQMLGLLCTALAYWSFYWQLKTHSVSEVTALLLSAIPFVLFLVYVGRKRIAYLVDRVGKVKFKGLEIEFDNASRRVQERLAIPLRVQEGVFSRKRPIRDLVVELRQAVRQLSLLPVNQRVLHLQVDISLQNGATRTDAAALYFYLLVLRAAATRVHARVAGILLYHGPAYIGVIETSDYIIEFERCFPDTRQQMARHEMDRLLDHVLETGEAELVEMFERLMRENEANTWFDAFLPHMVTYLHPVRVVSSMKLTDLTRLLRDIVDGDADYLVVLDGSRIMAVIPTALLTLEVARAVARAEIAATS